MTKLIKCRRFIWPILEKWFDDDLSDDL